MTIERTNLGGVAHLRVIACDAVEFANAAELKRAAIEALDDRRDVVVDLGGVEFIDSAGVGALVGVFRAARARGRRAIFAALSPGVLSVLAIIKLDEILDLSPDAEAAVRSCRSRPVRAV